MLGLSAIRRSYIRREPRPRLPGSSPRASEILREVLGDGFYSCLSTAMPERGSTPPGKLNAVLAGSS